jgi:hypothetical protein
MHYLNLHPKVQAAAISLAIVWAGALAAYLNDTATLKAALAIGVAGLVPVLTAYGKSSEPKV